MIGNQKPETRNQKAVGWIAFWFLVSAFWFLVCGCRTSDKVEAELRTRERELRELREERYRTEAYNQALERELHDFRRETASKTAPEQASQIYTIKEIVLGRQTGGYDDDRWPGDESLQVVVEPRDPDGHAIKVPGVLHVLALEISPEGLKTPFSSWNIPVDRLRKSWRSGLLSTGYYLILPWKVWPLSDKLRVIVQFTLADGRVFEADKDVTIRSTPARYRKAPSAVPSGEPELLCPPDPEPPTLPPPRKVDGDGTQLSNRSGPGWFQTGNMRSTSYRRPSSPPLSDAVQILRPVPFSH